jgi:cytochrome b6-f complex iron-sulfur subunit
MTRGETQNAKNMQRREFVSTLVAGTGSILVGVDLLTVISGCSVSSPTAPSGPAELVLNLDDNVYKSLETIGGTVALTGNSIDGTGLLLYRVSDVQVDAYSRRCTHQGCTIGPFVGGRSTCPCHGSVFNTSGKPVSGPAQASLQQYSTSLTGNSLTISR